MGEDNLNTIFRIFKIISKLGTHAIWEISVRRISYTKLYLKKKVGEKGISYLSRLLLQHDYSFDLCGDLPRSISGLFAYVRIDANFTPNSLTFSVKLIMQEKGNQLF